MSKPVRLEINNSGAWKVIGRFDAASDLADDILMCAAHLADALNSPLSGRPGIVTLRVSMAEAPHPVLMYWDGASAGWVERVEA